MVRKDERTLLRSFQKEALEEENKTPLLVREAVDDPVGLT